VGRPVRVQVSPSALYFKFKNLNNLWLKQNSLSP
jgi:hypothetical protein